MGNLFSRKKSSEICDYCDGRLSENNPYIFNIRGYGKHDGRTMCQHCLILRFEKKSQNWKNR